MRPRYRVSKAWAVWPVDQALPTLGQGSGHSWGEGKDTWERLAWIQGEGGGPLPEVPPHSVHRPTLHTLGCRRETGVA